MKGIYLILVVLFLSACSNDRAYSEMLIENAEHAIDEELKMPTTTRETAPSKKSDAKPYDPSNSERKIIKTGTLKLKVKETSASTDNIISYMGSKSAYLANSQLYQSGNNMNQFLQFRIPAEYFEEAITEIKKNGLELINENINSKDVSEEFVDLQSRLKTKKEVRDRYILVLRNKASTVEEILLAEETIRRIQEEIEAKEGRLKFLLDQTSYSTININLIEEIQAELVVAKTYPFFKEAKESLKSGSENILMFIVGILKLWPYIIILSLVVWKHQWMSLLFKKRLFKSSSKV